MASSHLPVRLGLFLLGAAFFVTSCSQLGGTSSQEVDRDMPAWFLDNRPMDPHHIFAAATATGSRLQMASSKAASRARGDIAATVETRFQGLTKQFQEEVGEGQNAESVEQFTQAYKSVVNQTINGAEVVEREIRREDGGYRAYVLMRMPIGQAQEKLLQQIEASQNAFTRFRSTQAFEELEQEVEGHRQREKEQEARRQGQRSSQADLQSEFSDSQPQQEQTAGQQQTTPANDGQELSGESAPEGAEREVEAAEMRDAGEKPTAEQVQAPEPESEPEPQAGAPMTEAQQIESRLRSAAEPWMGTPYKFGGESRDGVDCSGLTQALYQDAFNIELPRTTGRQVNRGSAVSRSEMRSGDLVFFRTADQQKHVGIYLEGQRFLHASSSQGVTISPLTIDYWRGNYWTTRRLSVL